MIHNLIEKGCLCGPPVSSSQSDCFYRRHIGCMMSNFKSLAIEHDIRAGKGSCDSLWTTTKVEIMYGCYITVWKTPCNLHPPNNLGDAEWGSNVTFTNSWVMLNFCLVAWIWRSIDSLCGSESFNGNETGSQILSQFVDLWGRAESVETRFLIPVKIIQGREIQLGVILWRGDAEATWQKGQQEQRPLHWTRKAKQN